MPHSKVIVAPDVTNEPSDKKQLRSMVKQAKKYMGRGRRIDKFSSGSGYFIEHNVTWIEGQCIEALRGDGPVEAQPGRYRHIRAVDLRMDRAPTKRWSGGSERRKDHETYAERERITEPVYGQIERGLCFTHFLPNGINKMRSDWRMVCLAHNLRKP